MTSKNNNIRSMAELLRGGAVMTDLSCPACSSPLFRLKSGDLWCEQCKKKVVVVKEGEEFEATRRPTTLDIVEATLVEKIENINKRIREEEDINELQKLNMVLASLLENLEKVRKTGKPKN